MIRCLVTSYMPTDPTAFNCSRGRTPSCIGGSPCQFVTDS
jgi:hypothetical protein